MSQSLIPKLMRSNVRQVVRDVYKSNVLELGGTFNSGDGTFELVFDKVRDSPNILRSKIYFLPPHCRLWWGKLPTSPQTISKSGPPREIFSCPITYRVS